ncbi:MAG: hypothetical protein NTZ93_01495 [Candidatus Beckwithbacteria bacterium]|nr:hypothetical protein [Candidatus Beckwithbacteria bacterium]
MKQKKSKTEDADPLSQPPASGKNNNLSLYVYNMPEDEWLFIDSVAHRPKRTELITDCEDVADCYFLGSGKESDLIYVSPKPISPAFQEYAQKLMGYKNTEVIVPQTKTHLICDDLLQDTVAFEKILNRAKNYQHVILTSYAASPQMYSLKAMLQKSGINVITPELPDPANAWTVNFFGSKSGIRQLAQQSVAKEPDFIMPEGLICFGKYDAAKIAADRYIREKGVVIKTNKGSGGSGVLIFREGDLPFDYSECERAIITKMNSDNYWDYFPIVVEDLISANLNSAGIFPNVEFKIHRNGRIEFLYYCETKVTPKGVYYGLDIGDNVLNDRLTARIIDTGYYIAEKYSAAGYRGHFDVDMMVARNGQVYVNESNTRNTGGTDIYRIVRKLLGKDFADSVHVLTRGKSNLPKNIQLTFPQILKKCAHLLYNHKKHEGLIINSENSLTEGKIVYTTIAKLKSKAIKYEADLLKILEDLPLSAGNRI